jgi:short-subunit dehydrogenase
MSPAPVLITGASGGIGADLARICARQGHPLALAARNEAALQALADELGTPGGRRPLVVPLDLAEPGATAALVAALTQADFEPSILMNNAGYGLNGQVARLDHAAQLGIVDLNIRALTELTLAFLPAITATKGRILNVASIAAFLPGPGMAVSYASKAYVLSFSQALAEELKGSGATVTALCPGPTATDFFSRAGGKASKLKAFGMMKSMDVAEAGYSGMMAGRRVVVPGFANKFMATFSPLTPRALLLPFIARVQLGK